MRDEGQVPDWLADLGGRSLDGDDASEESDGEQVSDWLAGLSGEALGDEQTPASPEEQPDWLAGLRDQFAETQAAEGFSPPEADAQGSALPPWLEGGDMPSGEEALSWLEQLAAGKEEELTARAEAEAEIRMAEIMGRPAPAAPLPQAAPEEAAPVRAEPPQVPPAPAAPAPAEVPGWLQGLAPQEAAAEKAAPSRATPAPVEPAPAEVPSWLQGLAPSEATAEKAMPVPAEVPDWLQGLAPQEAPPEEAVPAKAAPVPAEVPGWLQGLAPQEAAAEKAAPAPSEVPDWLQGPAPQEAPPEEAAELSVSVPEGEEAFGWAAFGEPAAPVTAPPQVQPAAEEAEPSAPMWLEGEKMPSGEEALAWLEQLAAGKEEELTARAEAEAEVRVAELMGRPAPAEGVVSPPPTPETAPLPIEEAAEFPAGEFAVPSRAKEAVPEAEEAFARELEKGFGWAGLEEPEVPPELLAAQAPPLGEVALPEAAEWFAEEAPLPEELAPEQPAGIPIEAEARVEEELPLPAPEPQPQPPPAAAEEVHWGEALDLMMEMGEVPPVSVEEEPEPKPMAGPAVRPQVPPEGFAVGGEPFAAERAHLMANPRDYEARLRLARALWQAGEWTEALEAYSRVIGAGKFLDRVIVELEGYVEQRPGVQTRRVLGDAYMKEGRLQEALDLYRKALEAL